MSRFVNKKISLDQKKISDFFEGRARKFDPDHPLTSVMYQDSHPEIAVKRDVLEKARIEPLLRLTGKERVLDIGCGIGRWAEAIKNNIAVYHGVDASLSLIEIARKRCIQSNIFFHSIGAEDITDDWFTCYGPFDRVILSGILIYLDDLQVSELLAVIARRLLVGGLVYIREPMGVERRLTLSDHWSEELSADYNAIYRSRKEISESLEKAFTGLGVNISGPEPLFDESDLNNRIDTRQYFCFVEKIS